jgi:hypothetical protein
LISEQLYEQKRPETKAGVAGGKARQGSATDNLSFAADTAAKTGRTERGIRRYALRGEKISRAGSRIEARHPSASDIARRALGRDRHWAQVEELDRGATDRVGFREQVFVLRSADPSKEEIFERAVAVEVVDGANDGGELDFAGDTFEKRSMPALGPHEGLPSARNSELEPFLPRGESVKRARLKKDQVLHVGHLVAAPHKSCGPIVQSQLAARVERKSLTGQDNPGGGIECAAGVSR